MLAICEQNVIAFVPYFSLLQSLVKKYDRVAVIAQKYNVTEPQVNIATGYCTVRPGCYLYPALLP